MLPDFRSHRYNKWIETLWGVFSDLGCGLGGAAARGRGGWDNMKVGCKWEVQPCFGLRPVFYGEYRSEMLAVWFGTLDCLPKWSSLCGWLIKGGVSQPIISASGGGHTNNLARSAWRTTKIASTSLSGEGSRDGSTPGSSSRRSPDWTLDIGGWNGGKFFEPATKAHLTPWCCWVCWMIWKKRNAQVF